MINYHEIYDQCIRAERDLVEDVRFKRKINIVLIRKCSVQICEYLSSNTNFMVLLNAVQDKNPYLYSHPVNVALVAYVIGKWMKLSEKDLEKIVCTGLLHDIGKAKIRDSILNKPDKLTYQEMGEIRRHPIYGYSLLADLNVLEPEILLGVLYHHERNDGSGYPRGKKGEEINLFSRIIAVADIYDAITATKSYHTKSSPFKAVEEIEESSFASLDPQICQIFLKHISDFYSGSTVRLSNELVGEIVYVNPEERTKPLVRCENEYHDLIEERKIEIVEILSNLRIE